ncbi:hypothetical protein KBB96_04965 [Luteolibacter ambystomatis]|uniref:Uncharacterized protein n=1 Tax=Luteolibacter ambystomatis TaxID=2824561 RepID=A0A975J1D6_9BACT|nr:hypothetical protein [Luteolibacter ambystomatis]QUE52243.1 hypothetical protein KBB96_04965 [Luteolibacter ambystomatis]
MKDKQASAPAPKGGIPVISPVLHFFSMPILVLWRRRFGYAYLRPKSVFLASIFASTLFAWMAWHEPAWQPRYLPLAGFLVLFSMLYLVHLGASITANVAGRGEHDQFSGHSHLLSLIPAGRRHEYESMVHTIVEPLLTAIGAWLLSPTLLGTGLFIFSIALALKELVRSWQSLRLKKRFRDNLNDASETMDATQPAALKPISATGRTQRERFPRNCSEQSDVDA